MTDHLPNFLIAGAAKSGTTSLYYYLMDHPEIYFSKIKEPEYLTSEVVTDQYLTRLSRRPYIKTLEEYKILFSDVKNEKAIGEGSTDTIYYYHTTIPRIMNLLGDPKIIIMMRNPPYAAFSMYSHMIRDNQEDLSFEDALAMEDERIRNHQPCAYHYKARALYAHQVKAFLEAFSQVKVLIYEEFIRDIPGTIKEVCSFLEIDPNYQPTNTSIRYNASGVPRLKWFNNIFTMKNPIQRHIRKIGMSLLSGPVYAGLRDSIRQKNIIKLKMKPETLAYLKEYYHEDILTLQKILDRDLGIWLNEK